ncbi:MAG: exo-alpha-sialidase, partial [candidate division Zixibacteria bacterium]|nr:exo-alpha-sialidase [candidate division Zixibacteria bacterium]
MTHRYIITILLVAITIFAASCSNKSSTGKIVGITPIATPALAPSGEPNICTTPEGGALLSWVEKDTVSKVSTLRYSDWQDGGWSEAKTIAQGSDWFVNWADFPAVAVKDDGRLFASWLVKSAASTYAYDVTLALSSDDGKTWSEPFS